MQVTEMRTDKDEARAALWLWRRAPFVAASLVFLLMTALYAGGQRPLYYAIIRAWGVDPFPWPFLDTETVLSALRCWRAGIDVIVVNPCDPLARVFDYSPLWLQLARLPVTTAWIAPVGLLVSGAFLLSLLLLPPARAPRQLVYMLLGVLSPAVVFAVERGNNDLVLFTLAAVAATLASRSPALRWIGYGAALLAGLLKYYPMTLMLLASRERPVRFLAVAAASAAVFLLLVAAMYSELTRTLQEIPTGPWFDDMFGSSTLGGGVSRLMDWSDGISVTIHVVMALAAFAIGVALGLRPRVGAALHRLTELERNFLLASALLMLGCFFTAQNIGYRASHLLLALPALTALWHRDTSRLWPFASMAAVGLLWTQWWRPTLLDALGWLDVKAVFVTGWAIREALWWGLITILIGLVTALMMRSTMGQWLLRRIPGTPARSAHTSLQTLDTSDLPAV